MGNRAQKSDTANANLVDAVAWIAARTAQRRGSGSKYNAIRTSVGGRSFASRAEAARYSELVMLEQSGGLRDLVCQPSWRFPIAGAELRLVGSNRPVRYTADFQYFCVHRNKIVVEDVKGVLLADAALRIALMRAVHNITVELVTTRKSRRR